MPNYFASLSKFIRRFIHSKPPDPPADNPYGIGTMLTIARDVRGEIVYPRPPVIISARSEGMGAYLHIAIECGDGRFANGYIETDGAGLPKGWFSNA